MRLQLRRGFTLVELIVSVLLIDVALLALVAGSAVVVRRQVALRTRLGAARAAANRLETLAIAPCADASGTANAERGIVETWQATVGPTTRRDLRDSVVYVDGREQRNVVLRLGHFVLMRRPGLTLVELLVTMTVAGMTLAMVASISLREQRVFADLSDQAALANQLHEAGASIPIDLRPLAPHLGDIRDARDTALEIRSTIASALVCDSTTAGGFILAPAAGSPPFASFGSPLEAGDSLWLLSTRSDSDVWSAVRIVAVGSSAGNQCAAGGPELSSSARTAPRITVAVNPALTPAIGAAVRVTRSLRFSLYHASDGGWYVGERDWNNAANKFNTIQPLAGPFSAPTGSAGGLSFRYLDSTGATLASPVADPTLIALVSITLRGQTRSNTRALGAAQASVRHADSTIVAVALRNR